MFLNTKALILVGLSLLFTLGAADDCGNGPWAPVSWTGANTGVHWCDTKWKQGPIISGVEVWSNTQRVKAIRFTFSDGTVGPLHGRIDGDIHGQIKWNPSTDKIVQATTWGDGRGRRLGRVYLKTATGIELNVGKDTGGQESFDHVVGSAGIMMGAFGNAGYDIDALGFLFLRGEIKKITIGDVKFDQSADDLNGEKTGLQPVSLDYQRLINTSNDPVSKDIDSKRIEKVSKTWSSSTMHTFGFKYTIEASGEIMDIGLKSSYELSYQYQNTETLSETTEETKEFGWKFKMSAAPGQSQYCRCFAWQGEFNGKYRSTIKIELEDGFVISYPEEGDMKQVQWSESTDECRDEDFNDGIPKSPARRGIEFSA